MEQVQKDLDVTDIGIQLDPTVEQNNADCDETRQQVAEGGYHPPYICNLEDPQEPILKIW